METNKPNHWEMQIGGSIIPYLTVDGLKHISQRKLPTPLANFTPI